MRVVVTGGAGFIGSHVADAFLMRGDDVVVVDDLSAGKQENVPDGAELVRHDIAEPFELECDLVCHLAAQASVTVSTADPLADARTNVLGTLNVCELGATVLYAATGGALYGDRAPRPTTEEFAPQPESPYGASKFSGEAYVGTWGRLNGTPNVVLRLANVYGPRQNAHGEAGVVAIFSEHLVRGEAPTIRGDGTPTRDYVHVSDVAAAFVAAAEAGRPGVFNVGTGVETSTARVLELLQEAAGTSIEPKSEPLKPGEMQASCLDASLIRRELGWEPRVAVADGMRDAYRWYSQQR